MKKLMTLGAFGLGYVLGTKAGRERYEQIRQLARAATKNVEGSGMLQNLEKYRAQLEAHTSRPQTPKT